VSVSRYLNSRGLNNKFELEYLPEPNMANPLGRELQDRLVKVGQGDLGKDGIFERFSAYEGGEAPCFSLTFGSASQTASCPEIARF
jgi:hypothetical protein